MPITEPGIYGLPVDAYHLDPAPAPSLSAHSAEDMLLRSARHVWTQEPKLNPEAAEGLTAETMPSDRRLRMEHGSALHSLILGAGRMIEEIDDDAYRTNKSKNARADAVANGRIPILTAHKPKLLACAAAVAEQVKNHPRLREVLGETGRAEQTMLWQEPIGTTRTKRKAPTIWCRALVDWLPDDPRLPMVDFKFTSTSTAPQTYERTVREDIALRAAHYTRGAQRLRTRKPGGYWIVAVEFDAPHGLAVYDPDTALMHHAREQWSEAATRWHACMSRGTEREHWPFWPAEVVKVGPSDFQLRDWEREKRAFDIRTNKGGTISVARVRQLMQTIGGPVQ